MAFFSQLYKQTCKGDMSPTCINNMSSRQYNKEGPIKIFLNFASGHCQAHYRMHVYIRPGRA